LPKNLGLGVLAGNSLQDSEKKLLTVLEKNIITVLLKNILGVRRKNVLTVLQ
jgi:hypothetical protein